MNIYLNTSKYIWKLLSVEFSNVLCEQYMTITSPPQYFMPIVWWWWTSMDSVRDCCHIISHFEFSFSPESIFLSLPLCCQPFHLLHHLCHTHPALPICFISFFMASLFHLWPFLFNGSLIFLALALLSFELSPKLPYPLNLSCFTLLRFFF